MKRKVARFLGLTIAASMVFTGTAFAKNWDYEKIEITENDGPLEILERVENDTDSKPTDIKNDAAKVTIEGNVITFKNKIATDYEGVDSLDSVYGLYIDNVDMDVNAVKGIEAKAGDKACNVYGTRFFIDDGKHKLTVGDVSAESTRKMSIGSYDHSEAYGVNTFVEGNAECVVEGTNVDVKAAYGDAFGVYAKTFEDSKTKMTFKNIVAEGDCVIDDDGKAEVYGFVNRAEGNAVLDFSADSIKAVADSKYVEAYGVAVRQYEDCKSTISVSGDISGTNGGVIVNIDDKAEVTINCLGTISGKQGAIVYTGKDEKSTVNVNAWKLESEGDVIAAKYILMNYDPKAEADKLAKTAEEDIAKINYIIKTNETNSQIILTAADGSDLKDTGDAFEKVYKTQNEKKDIVVNVVAASGYTVTGLDAGTGTDGNKIVAVKNADGTWTVTVPRGGGVDITPILEAIAKRSQDEEYNYVVGGISAQSGQWIANGSNWQYRKGNGELAANEWQLITNADGTQSWYHFGNEAKMTTGWMTDANDGYTYYLDPATGKMAVGTVVIDGKTYHFNENGPAASGWTQNTTGTWVYEKKAAIPLGALIG